LPGGDSLARLLPRHFGVSNHKRLPRLTVEQILAWADAHRRATGQGPSGTSGPVRGAPEENWMCVNAALRVGLRGLPGGGSLARLLAQCRGAHNPAALPGLTIKQILAWADAYCRRAGRWRGQESGPIPEAPGETWAAVDSALYAGRGGLPGGDSFYQLLRRRRGARRAGRNGAVRVTPPPG
jgi:hypothetical protein